MILIKVTIHSFITARWLIEILNNSLKTYVRTYSYTTLSLSLCLGTEKVTTYRDGRMKKNKQTNKQTKKAKKTGTQGKGIKQLAIQPCYFFIIHVYMENALCFYLGYKRFLHSIYWLVCESLQSMLYILLECFVFRVCAQFICTILMQPIVVCRWA